MGTSGMIPQYDIVASNGNLAKHDLLFATAASNRGGSLHTRFSGSNYPVNRCHGVCGNPVGGVFMCIFQRRACTSISHAGHVGRIIVLCGLDRYTDFDRNVFINRRQRRFVEELAAEVEGYVAGVAMVATHEGPGGEGNRHHCESFFSSSSGIGNAVWIICFIVTLKLFNQFGGKRSLKDQYQRELDVAS